MEEKQTYGRVIQTSRKSRRIDRRTDRRIIKDLERLNGGKKRKGTWRDWGKEGDHNGDITIFLSQDAKMQTRQAAGKKRTETERNRITEREKDKRTNKYEKVVLCLERSRHTSKTPASQCRSTLTYPLGVFPLQERFQEPRNFRCIFTRGTRAFLKKK